MGHRFGGAAIDSAGHYLGYVGSVIDITDRRQQEVELRAANQMKDEFLATLSHELRTPLNAMIGWAQMLRAGSLRPEMTARAVESIHRTAQGQAQLVDDLLDMSRIAAAAFIHAGCLTAGACSTSITCEHPARGATTEISGG